MAGPGALRDRATFQAETQVPDGGGGHQLGWADVAGCTNIPANFAPERGRERLSGDRLQVALGGVLRVRSSSETRVITERHRVSISGTVYNIRSVANPDRRGRYLEMTVERADASGVAT